MTRRIGSAALSIVLVWSLATICVAQAEPTPEAAPDAATRAAASEHFRLGVELFREGAFAAALLELRRANALVPDFRVHFNIAQAELSLSDYAAASVSLQRYLDEGGVLVEPRRRREIEAQIVELSRRTGKLRIVANVVDADIALDGAPLGKAPLADEITVSIGRHTVTARTADGASASQSLDVVGGDHAEVTLELVAAQPGEKNLEARKEAPYKLPARLGRRTRWGIGLLGGGVALGLGALTSWWFSGNLHDDYERMHDDPMQHGAAHKAKRRSDALLLFAEVGGATGVALTATSIVLFLTVLTELTSGDDETSSVAARGSAREQNKQARAGLRSWNVGLGSLSFSQRF